MPYIEAGAPGRRVCIFGAGISGLRCTDVLLLKSKVTILEARNRIGGRVIEYSRPMSWANYMAEIGPNSDESHPVYKLATDTATPLHHWNNKQLIYDPSGKALPAEQIQRLSTLLGREFRVKSQDSLQDFIRRRAEEVVPDEVERKLLVQMSDVFGAYVGEPVWKQSLRFAWMEIWDLSTFRAPNNRPAILFYLYGDCLRHIVNIYDKPKVDKTRLLDDFFRPYYSCLPKYSADDPDCKLKAILATEWLKDGAEWVRELLQLTRRVWRRQQ
ncbi:hypothetical protein B0T25DRAFT_616206 [Lasiosphaeria hispida]|uniref:Amine oxidase domain-containing protein n=1 Tax=Lasiosphaeria hispida TaxID=260671 RepID=A0AAJ0MAC6_9PEZI|nr:hypothetical protein B0T25DRAFT_616206 [Lasiosphaeria hispida]